MRYLDTSVLLAFLIPEAGSSEAEALMTSAGNPLVISTWSEVELMSALGVKLRTGQMTEREAHSVIDRRRPRALPGVDHVI
jgi:predicted nucleic acid-binding protein